MGENITTRGIDLLGLPRDTVLRIGESAAIQLTGLRNPCKQLEDFQTGLIRALIDKTPAGEIIRKSGVMSIVITGGPIKADDTIEIQLPEGPHHKMERI